MTGEPSSTEWIRIRNKPQEPEPLTTRKSASPAINNERSPTFTDGPLAGGVASFCKLSEGAFRPCVSPAWWLASASRVVFKDPRKGVGTVRTKDAESNASFFLLKVRFFALFVEALRPQPLLWWFASASSVGFGSLGAALGFLCLPESGLFTFWQRLRLASGIWKMLIFCFYKNFVRALRQNTVYTNVFFSGITKRCKYDRQNHHG